MDPVLAGITVATFIKDLVELGRNIKHSIDQVSENKEQLSRLGDEVTGTLSSLVKLTQGFDNAQPSLDLSTALEDLKSHLERIYKKSKQVFQHTLWFKSWWNRQKIDQDIKRLNELKKDCYEQFTLFSTARIEGKADQIVDTTARIQSTADRVTDTTTRTQATAVQIADITTRIEAETEQITSTTAQIQTDIAQVASTSARIEDSTSFLMNTTYRIEQTTNEVQLSVLQARLEKWLEYPPNMKRRQDDTQELQHEGTGSWLLDSDQFKGWKEKPGSLWIRGDSGTGKSVLSSIVIRQLFEKRQDRTAIAYFYFDFRDEKCQRVKIMLQSIILQLSVQSPNFYSALEREYKSSQGQTLPTYNNLLAILDELLSDFGHTYLVLDALDDELLPLSHLTRCMRAEEIVAKVVKKSFA
ncbi:hypothetical protein B0H14DRAFT_3504662 [Mycena olivaceomarginata]|nr:hypothetical protein B0H14DRAFT_3504662 [Mycena olivaceomarginata]